MTALRLISGLVLGGLMTMPAQAFPVIAPAEWQAYLEAFVTADGRVVDTANGNISHSEGQGYGLVLAALAEDRASFERILAFTRSALLVREDGLAAWRWDPQTRPPVTDFNNATDGDMLIAYGMLIAGETWSAPELIEDARQLVKAIGRTMVVTADGMPAILPGTSGFSGDETTGNEPVLNPSYWIFEMLPAFHQLDPETGWLGLHETGLEILRRAAATPAGVPGDWIVLKDGGIAPAPSFAPQFGYNGIRIPLYLMRAGIDPAYLLPFRQKASAAGLFVVDVASGSATEPIREPGYRLIQAAMECTVTGRPVPEELRSFAPTSYYAATLQLLMLDHLRRQRGSCLVGETTP